LRHGPEQGRVEFRPGLEAGADRIEHALPGAAALDHRVDQPGLEVRLGEDTDDLLLGDPLSDLADPPDAGLVGVAEADRADRLQAKARLEIMIGVVEDDVGPAR
jgi:hypothetical protein